MSNQRTTFLKRNREQNRKDKAVAKQVRLAARRTAARLERESLIAAGADPNSLTIDSLPTNDLAPNGVAPTGLAPNDVPADDAPPSAVAPAPTDRPSE